MPRAEELRVQRRPIHRSRRILGASQLSRGTRRCWAGSWRCSWGTVAAGTRAVSAEGAVGDLLEAGTRAPGGGWDAVPRDSAPRGVEEGAWHLPVTSEKLCDHTAGEESREDPSEAACRDSRRGACRREQRGRGAGGAQAGTGREQRRWRERRWKAVSAERARRRAGSQVARDPEARRGEEAGRAGAGGGRGQGGRAAEESAGGSASRSWPFGWWSGRGLEDVSATALEVGTCVLLVVRSRTGCTKPHWELRSSLAVTRRPESVSSETVETAGDPNGPMWRIRRLKGTSGPRCQGCIWIDMGRQEASAMLESRAAGICSRDAKASRQTFATTWDGSVGLTQDWRGRGAANGPFLQAVGKGLGWDGGRQAGVPAAGQDMPGFICAAHGLA